MRLNEYEQINTTFQKHISWGMFPYKIKRNQDLDAAEKVLQGPSYTRGSP